LKGGIEIAEDAVGFITAKVKINFTDLSFYRAGLPFERFSQQQTNVAATAGAELKSLNQPAVSDAV